MLKGSWIALGMALLVASTASCILDPKQDQPTKPPTGSGYGDLTVKEDVLRNLEQSYNDRNITRYGQILDQDFTFFFSTGDVGGTIPVSWGRPDELDATTLLFDRKPPDPFPTCTSIQMNLKWEDGVQWVSEPQSGGPHDGETWYTTTVFYDFTFHMAPDNTYLAVPGAKAQFTVRDTNAGIPDKKPHWQLIEFRDLGNP